MVNALAFAGHTYEPTDEDRLWLLRAVAREGADQDQVAQALVNGFCHAYAAEHEHSLAHHVQAYAQPINPRWFPEGDLFKHWHAIDPAKYSQVAAERRRDVYSQATTFQLHVQAAAIKALTCGPFDIPASCTDYAAWWLINRWQTPLTAPVRNGPNRLWTRAPGWTGYTVASASQRA